MSHSQWLLNLSCKIIRPGLMLFVFIFASNHLLAVNISAIYSSACIRDTGVIISVDDNTLQLMTLKGEIRSIPRFDIIYITNYPVGSIQIREIVNPEESDIITVKTIYENEVVDMVKGWMIDYSEDQISFLTTSGTQTIIDTADIWDIDITPMDGKSATQKSETIAYRFVHPYPFMHCKQEVDGDREDKPVHTIYPQHLLEDPLLIKRELDRLKEGYDRIRKYENNRRFYPVPQVYDNETSLGVWINLGNRFGSSKNRSNSFIPSIVRESTDGPFSFQSLFITGSYPMFFSVHEEPQIQAYYKMKASYIHFSIMLDLSLYTMGSGKYRWTEEDLEAHDDRENEFLHLAGGFDFGPFSLDMTVINKMYYAVQQGANFHDEDMDVDKGSISYHNRFFRMELYHGFGYDRKPKLITMPDDVSDWEEAWIDAYNEHLRSIADYYANFQFYRFNLDLFNFGKLHPKYSLIYRTLDFERKPNGDGLGAFKYASRSVTNALYLSYPIADQLKLSGYISVEIQEKKFGEEKLDEEKANTYPKGGLSLALLF